MSNLVRISSRVVAVGWMVFQGSGCDLANQTASLGGNSAGGRGSIRVAFINNTSFRTLFTTGMYDSNDQDTQPDFMQFGGENSELTLNENESSDVLELGCARVFAMGSPNLLRAIRDNLPQDASDPSALVSGVQFFEPPAEGTDESVSGVLSGVALPFEALLGVDFPCNALLIIRFETDDVGTNPFRIDFELVPSESDR
ncbi:MAG: hypothetical protein AABZ47_17855 [Planctomycetota bacterium]